MVGLILLLGGGAAFAKGAPPVRGKAVPPDNGPPPVAGQVVVRRQTSLPDALRLVLSRAKDLTAASGVAVVLDATAAVRESAVRVVEALASLSPLANRPKAWQVGVLGGTLSATVDDPAALGPVVEAALKQRVAVTADTLGMLRHTLSKFAGAGLVLYLAHAHFEDDVDLEGFIASLRAEKRTLAVLGPEAAFERPWGDLFADQPARPSHPLDDAAPGVGRNPFGPQDPKAPWHSGDTAYPHLPWSLAYGLRWETAFYVRLPDPPKGSTAPDHAWVPVPSGFGPYGLMRAAGATGGCYVLWGWTASDVAPVAYDYGHCDLLAPDLRPRAQILSDLTARPLAAALLQAWTAMASLPDGLVQRSPPWKGGGPAPIDKVYGLFLFGIFDSAKDRDDEVARAKSVLGEIDGVRTALDEASRGAGEPKDDVDRRYRADIHLLLHALDTARFCVGEYAAWAAAIRKQAWLAKRSKVPCLEDEEYVRPATADEPVVPAEGVTVRDPEGAQRLLASRAEFLARYRGTPFAALVAKNKVCTFRVDVLDVSPGPVDPPKPGRGSSTGGGPTTPPPSGGSSGSPGPTTGK